MDSFERVHGLVQQKCRVVHQHIDEFDKLFAGFGFVDDSNFVYTLLPHGLENDRNVVANGELVVKLGRSACLLHI